MDEELMQYEEIIPLNDTGNCASKKFLDSLHLKYSNRRAFMQTLWFKTHIEAVITFDHHALVRGVTELDDVCLHEGGTLSVVDALFRGRGGSLSIIGGHGFDLDPELVHHQTVYVGTEGCWVVYISGAHQCGLVQQDAHCLHSLVVLVGLGLLAESFDDRMVGVDFEVLFVGLVAHLVGDVVLSSDLAWRVDQTVRDGDGLNFSFQKRLHHVEEIVVFALQFFLGTSL